MQEAFGVFKKQRMRQAGARFGRHVRATVRSADGRSIPVVDFGAVPLHRLVSDPIQRLVLAAGALARQADLEPAAVRILEADSC